MHLKNLPFFLLFFFRDFTPSTKLNDFNQYCEELKQRFVSQGYKPDLINKHIKKVEKLDRKDLFKERDNPTSKETKTSLVSTYRPSLPNISKVVPFRRNKNFKELIASDKIEQNKVKKYNNIIKKSKYSPCSVNNSSLCCKQSVISSPTFKSQQINKSYTTFHKVKCSSGYGIYLMEYTLCKKQYVGKSGTSFNIRLNNHCKDLKKT